MERRVSAVILVLGFLVFCSTGCAMKEVKPPEEPVMVDYNVPFVDGDRNNDGVMTAEEFEAYFPKGEQLVFKEADTNGNGVVEHNEWHIFKKISGYEEKKGK